MLRITTAVLLWVMLSGSALAWDAFGHMQIAGLAWDKLDAPVRARATELLTRNPQHGKWIEGVPAAKRDQTAFMRAATWPDFIRDAPGYITDGPENGNKPPPGPEASQNIGYTDFFRHKYWHFVDRPFTQDDSSLEQPPVPNAQTQIAMFRTALSSPATSDDVKSYDLTWLLHIVGDVHQPLHATARFTAGHADAGGNFVKIDCGGCAATNLHWFWDDAGGTGGSADDALAAARGLLPADPQLAAITDENVWIGESFEKAKTHVYHAPIGAGSGVFVLTDTYKAAAAKLAKERIALAGARLANLLNAALK
jgi:hypothetical protein